MSRRVTAWIPRAALVATIVGAIAGLVVYLVAWPIPVSPVAWPRPAAADYVGPYAVNHRLAALQRMSLGGASGPEHVLAHDGWLYVAVESGAILRMRPDGSAREEVLRTGGRPLGFAFAPDGALIIADPLAGRHGGLWRWSAARQLELLTDEVAGTAIGYADAVIVGADGRYYFTDASRRFGARANGGTFEASVLDLLEQRCTGRVLVYDPATQTTATVMTDLCFANGIELSPDGQRLYVNETGRYRIWEMPLTLRAGSARHSSSGARILVDRLPGYPDNLTRGEEGRYWVGLVKPRSAFLDGTAEHPWLRAMAMRLPRSLWPVPPAYGHVVAFDATGRVLADLQDPDGAYPSTTGLTEAFGRRYVQSLHATALGYL